VKRRLLFALIFAQAIPAQLFGATASRLLPRVWDGGARLELLGSFEEDETRYGALQRTWNDTFFKERLTGFWNGYVYHPRFLLFNASLSGGLKQEEYASSWRAQGVRSEDSSYEYRLRLLFLPEHAYNFELFSSRTEPLFKEQAAVSRDSVVTSNGVGFRYRRSPYFFNARFSDDTRDSGEDSSRVETLALSGQYFRAFDDFRSLGFDAAYKPVRFSNSTGLGGTAMDASLANNLTWHWLRLSSSVARGEREQRDTVAQRIEGDQWTWQERLEADLPLHFEAFLGYDYRKDESLFAGPQTGIRQFSSTSSETELRLTHRLYESLDSRIDARHGSRSSASGSSTADSLGIGFNYSKHIPRGQVLLGASAGRSESSSRGRNDIVEEGHPGLAVPGSFTLAKTEIDRPTVALFLKSPLAPFELVPLSEGAHYTLAELGNTLEVTLFALPPRFAVPGNYEIRVSYSLLSGAYRLRSNSRSFSASVELFDHLLTPFATYSETDSEVVEGDFPGSELDATILTAGVLFTRQPLRARFEYRDVDWQTSPYRAWLGELQYIGPLGPSTTLYATVVHQERRFSAAGAAPPDRAPLETTESATGSLQQKLFRGALVFSVGGSYSLIRSRLETRAQAANAALQWKVGRLDFSAGANFTDSETTGEGVSTSGRTYRYYYLRLSRELF